MTALITSKFCKYHLWNWWLYGRCNSLCHMNKFILYGLIAKICFCLFMNPKFFRFHQILCSK